MDRGRRRNLLVALVTFAWYGCIEVACLLSGLSVLGRGYLHLLGGMVAFTFFWGAQIEGLLMAKPGEFYLDPQSKSEWKWYRHPAVKGIVYFVAPITAFSSRIDHWQIYLSMAAFIVIVIRVAWLVTKFVREPVSSQ